MRFRYWRTQSSGMGFRRRNHRSASTPPLLKIAEIRGKRPRYINVRGKVLYISAIRSWENIDNEGQVICFDIGDDTGTIRVCAFGETALYVGKHIRRDMIIEVRSAAVGPRKPMYNNLDHPFELTMMKRSALAELKNFPIEVIDEKIKFVSFEDVPTFNENVYFSVSGKVASIGTPLQGFGQERGTVYNKEPFEIEDEKKNRLKVVSWDGDIPLSEDLLGKTIAILRCKYCDKYNCITLSNAYIIIDGHRIK